MLSEGIAPRIEAKVETKIESKVETKLETKEDIILAVNNGNIDPLVGYFSTLKDDKAKEVANLRDKSGEPILQIATRRKHTSTFELLLDRGANPRAVWGPDDVHHIAAQVGAMEISRKLIERGIKPEQNKRNVWPSDMAKQQDHKDLLRAAEDRIQSKDGSAPHDSKKLLRTANQYRQLHYGGRIKH